MPPDVAAWIARSPLQLHADADALCERFATKRTWPKTDGDLRTVLFLRSLFAAEQFLSRSSRDYQERRHSTPAQWLSHFLVAGWYHDWRPWAQFHFGTTWSFPFDPWKLN